MEKSNIKNKFLRILLVFFCFVILALIIGSIVMWVLFVPMFQDFLTYNIELTSQGIFFRNIILILGASLVVATIPTIIISIVISSISKKEKEEIEMKDHLADIKNQAKIRSERFLLPTPKVLNPDSRIKPAIFNFSAFSETVLKKEETAEKVSSNIPVNQSLFANAKIIKETDNNVSPKSLTSQFIENELKSFDKPISAKPIENIDQQRINLKDVASSLNNSYANFQKPFPQNNLVPPTRPLPPMRPAPPTRHMSNNINPYFNVPQFNTQRMQNINPINVNQNNPNSPITRPSTINYDLPSQSEFKNYGDNNISNSLTNYKSSPPTTPLQQSNKQFYPGNSGEIARTQNYDEYTRMKNNF